MFSFRSILFQTPPLVLRYQSFWVCPLLFNYFHFILSVLCFPTDCCFYPAILLNKDIRPTRIYTYLFNVRTKMHPRCHLLIWWQRRANVVTMSMSRRASWDSIVSERVVPVIRHSSSDSDLEIKTTKRNFPPVPVKKSKLSLFRKVVPHKYSTRSQVDFKQVKLLEVGTSDPQAIGKKPSAWERTKSAIYNSPSLFARIVSLGRSGNSTSASDLRSNTSVSAGILPSLSTAIAPLLPTNFSEPPYSSSRIFAAAEEFLSDAPSVGDSDHPSVVQAGSYIDNLHTSPHSDESI